ncbi:MAG TPA: hypothetical protein VFT06_13805 [Flavisolibacter sp.]|nr:hypothetical protein [Flavisolibacter sp.]
MKGLDQFLLPYIISQLVALVILVAALKSTRLARLLFSLLFLYAAVINMQLSLRNPDAYLDYAPMALPFYRKFITGPFSQFNYILVPAIAVGQFFIGLGMLLRHEWVKAACIGAIVFLLAITPLMVGSAFPFPLIVAFAAWLILKNDRKAYLWQKNLPGIKLV